MAARALRLSSLVLLLGFISCQDIPRFGTVGENITLSPLSTVNFTEIVWKKGRNKVIEWNVNMGVIHYPLFRERVHLDSKSGDVVIFNLTPSDEDEYEIESVDLTNGPKFNLVVLDPLPSPILSCTRTNESIHVYCEMPPSYSRHREQLHYEWHCSLPQCERSSKLGAVVPYGPPSLHFMKDDDLSQEVHCYVENPESNRTSSMVLSDCVPGDKPRNRYALIAIPFVGIVSIIGFLNYAGRTERTIAR